jgi:hypothetical protein
MARPKKNADLHKIVNRDERPYVALPVPPELTDDEAGVFRTITASSPPGHLVPGDTELLAQLAKAKVMLALLEGDLKRSVERLGTTMVPQGEGMRVNPLFPEIRAYRKLVSDLLKALRLAPISRIQTRTAVLNGPASYDPERESITDEDKRIDSLFAH